MNFGHIFMIFLVPLHRFSKKKHNIIRWYKFRKRNL